MSEPGALVCGFADEATALAAVAWLLPGESGGLLVHEGDASVREAAIEGGEGDLEVRLKGDGVSCVATLTPRPGISTLADDGSGEAGAAAGLSAASCAARVRFGSNGNGREIDCAGHLTRWSTDPLEGAGVLRHLTFPAPDGGLLVVAASRDPGADNHGDERVHAWRLDAEGQATSFGEALLSTQYDENGTQTRAGLELWPAEGEAPPMRAAGFVHEETAARLGRVSAALLHTSTEGIEGMGAYLLWRR